MILSCTDSFSPLPLRVSASINFACNFTLFDILRHFNWLFSVSSKVALEHAYLSVPFPNPSIYVTSSWYKTKFSREICACLGPNLV